jgi:hypothetical protein
MHWMDEIASDSGPNQAYAWLCERHLDYCANDDVWDVRWRWAELRPRLQEWLRAGVYRIGAVRQFPAGGETIEVWPALDALVRKARARRGLEVKGAKLVVAATDCQPVTRPRGAALPGPHSFCFWPGETERRRR